jgi:hypothetical protein
MAFIRMLMAMVKLAATRSQAVVWPVISYPIFGNPELLLDKTADLF